MTDVLPFPRFRGSSGGQAVLPPGHVADILLFTGVRYERHAGDEPEGKAPDDRGRDDNANARRRKTRRRA